MQTWIELPINGEEPLIFPVGFPIGLEDLAELCVCALHYERISKKPRAHAGEDGVSESGSASILHRVQRHARDIGDDLAPQIVSDWAADGKYLLRRASPLASETQVVGDRVCGSFEDRTK